MMPTIQKFENGILTILSAAVEQTDALGRLLSDYLLPADVVSLDGDLGAGKTALTRGLAAGLGCRGPVSSPTFTLLIEHPGYAGGLALYHFDAYRLSGSDEFCEIGLDEYFDQSGVSVVEWGSIIAGVLPARTLQIRLIQSGPDHPDWRLIEMIWPGSPERLAKLISRMKELAPC